MFEYVFWMSMAEVAFNIRRRQHEDEMREARYERERIFREEELRKYTMAGSIDGECERITDIALPAPGVE